MYFSVVSSFSSSDGHKSSLRGRRTMPVASVVTLDMFLWRNYLICACCGAPPNVDSRSSDTRWVPGGHQVGTRWVAGGYRVGSRWVPGGYQVGTRWVTGGHQLGTGWAPGGYQLGTGWVPGGYQVGSRWAPGGYQVGAR